MRKTRVTTMMMRMKMTMTSKSCQSAFSRASLVDSPLSDLMNEWSGHNSCLKCLFFFDHLPCLYARYWKYEEMWCDTSKMIRHEILLSTTFSLACPFCFFYFYIQLFVHMIIIRVSSCVIIFSFSKHKFSIFVSSSVFSFSRYRRMEWWSEWWYLEMYI